MAAVLWYYVIIYDVTYVNETALLRGPYTFYVGGAVSIYIASYLDILEQ